MVGSQFKVKAISPGQIRHKEPSSSSTMSLDVVFLNEHHIPRCSLSGQPGRRGRAVFLGLKTRLRQPPAIPKLLWLTAC